MCVRVRSVAYPSTIELWIDVQLRIRARLSYEWTRRLLEQPWAKLSGCSNRSKFFSVQCCRISNGSCHTLAYIVVTPVKVNFKSFHCDGWRPETIDLHKRMSSKVTGYNTIKDVYQNINIVLRLNSLLYL